MQPDAYAGPDARLIPAFQRTVREMSWYRTLLTEAGVEADAIIDASSFTRLAPILTKANTFDRFPIDVLAATTSIRDLAGVLTSSGHGGRFSFGLTSREEAAFGPEFVDTSLDAAFGVKSHPTLVINCLPMGVGFTSVCTTIATTSVREDMAVALVRTFGEHYEQIVLVADPLFMKRLTDHAAAQALDWRHYRMQVLLGEEIFGEHFRGYVAACLGLEADDGTRGCIMSSFGVGELGLHLGYETPTTIALRRTVWRNPELAGDVLGHEVAPASVPMFLAFNPRRTFVEIVDPDADGFGQLTMSMLDPGLPIPLLRYQTGDLARLVDPSAAIAACRRHNIALPGELPPMLVALRGRSKDRLPNGADVGLYKDALYADHAASRQLSGAFRLVVEGDRYTLHVQRVVEAPKPGCEDDELAARIVRTLPDAWRPQKVIVWPYERFPFGMSIDYERKFTYL